MDAALAFGGRNALDAVSARFDEVVDRVRAAINADPRVGGRLALWGRRLVGEALSQAQRVAAERDALVAPAHRSRDGFPERRLAHAGRAHVSRVEALGAGSLRRRRGAAIFWPGA